MFRVKANTEKKTWGKNLREEFFKTSLVLLFLVLIFSKKSFFLITSFNFFNHQSRNQKNWIKLLNMLSKFKTLHSFLSPVSFRLSSERSNSFFLKTVAVNDDGLHVRSFDSFQRRSQPERI